MKSYWQLAGMTLWDLLASSLGHWQIVYVTLNTIHGVVQDFRKITTNHSRREIYGIYLKLISSRTCNGPELARVGISIVHFMLHRMITKIWKYLEDVHSLSEYCVYCRFWILITLFRFITMLCGILSVPQNIVMDLNNVRLV
jgi:hypothetical protein